MKICLLAVALLVGASRAFAQLSSAGEAAVRRMARHITATYRDYYFATGQATVRGIEPI